MTLLLTFKYGLLPFSRLTTPNNGFTIHWRTMAPQLHWSPLKNFRAHSFDKTGSNGNVIFILMYLSVRERYCHHKVHLIWPSIILRFLPLSRFLAGCDRFSVWQTFKFLTILFGGNLIHLQITELSRWRSCYKLTQKQMKLFTAFFVLFFDLWHVQLGDSCSPMSSRPKLGRPQPTCNHTK